MNPIEKILLDRVALWRNSASQERACAQRFFGAGQEFAAARSEALAYQLEACASQLERLAHVTR